MGLFDRIFRNNKNESFSNSISELPEVQINFDELVNTARLSGNSSDLSALYEAFFKLENWTFIVSNNCTFENAKPFIGVLEEQPWLFVFTDSKKADYYAKLFGNFLNNDGNTFVIKMTRQNSLNMIKELNDRGIIGIRINEGEHGWFCTIPSLFEIKDYLRIDG